MNDEQIKKEENPDLQQASLDQPEISQVLAEPTPPEEIKEESEIPSPLTTESEPAVAEESEIPLPPEELLPPEEPRLEPPPAEPRAPTSKIPPYQPPPESTSTFDESPPPQAPRRSLFKEIIFGLVILIVIGGLGFLAKKFLFETKEAIVSGQPVVVTYWGLWEEESIMQGLIEEFEKNNPGIKIKYELKSPRDYKARLQNSLLQKQGPDIFRLHFSWLPVLKDDLTSVPQEVVANLGLEKDYFAVIPKTLKINNQFYALPLMVDTLALYYNRQLLATSGEQPPRTWWGLQEVAKKVTVKDEMGKIKIAGAALGTTNNVDHWSDVVGLMLLQNGVDFKKIENNSKLIEDVLKFYTLFYLRDRVWDVTLPSSTLSFATNKLVFYFAPSWRIFNLLEINPNLDFAVAFVPKLPKDPELSDLEAVEKGEGELAQINWATFWAEGVSNQSRHQKEAWKFLEFLASKEGLQRFYQAASQVRDFGEIYPVKSLAQSLSANPRLTPFIDQAETASGWYLCSYTYDNGPNDVIIKYFADAINGINQGADPATATQTLIQGISQTVSRYQLP